MDLRTGGENEVILAEQQMATRDDVTSGDGMKNDLLRGRAVLHDCTDRDACRLFCDKRGNGVDHPLFRLQHGVAPQQGCALRAKLSLDLPLVSNEEDSTVFREAQRHLIETLPQRGDSLGAFDLYNGGLPVNKSQ